MFGRKKNQPDENINQQQGETRNRPAQRRLKRPRRWPYLLLMIVPLVFFLPNLIGWLGLHQVALNYFAADVRGSIKIEKFAAGWMQPVELSGITVVDDQQQPVFQAGSVRTEKTLFALATGSDYGVIEINQPICFLQMTPSGSNLEDVFVNYLRPAANPDSDAPNGAAPTDIPPVEIKVVDGQAKMRLQNSDQAWLVDSINGRVQTGATEAPLQVELAARVTAQTIDSQQNVTSLPPGALTLIGQVDAGANQLTFESIDVALETDRLQMSIAGPALERILGPVALAGTVTGSLQGNVNASDQLVAVSVKDIDCREAFFACPALIDQDQLHVQWLTCNGDAQLTPRLISANEFQLKSNLGRIRANGNFDVQQISQLGTSGSLLDSPFEMDGELDLAQLIAMVPKTLQLHQDLDLRSGDVTFQVNSRNTPSGPRRLVVNMDAVNLAATRSGKEIVWAKPLRLVGTLSEQNQKLSIESIRCESEFLNIKGGGDLRQAQFNVDGDLQLLTERIGQFVDLEGTSLAGTMKGDFSWRLVDEAATGNSIDVLSQSPIQISGNFVVVDPVIQTADLPRWAPQEIQVALAAVGHAKQLDDASTLQLDQGQIQLVLGTERAVAVLAQPVADVFTTDVWQAQCQAEGSLQNWLTHAQNFVDLGPINGAGQINVQSNVTLSGADAKFAGTVFRFDEFRFAGYGVQATESSVEGELAGRYVFETGVLEVPELTFVADSVSARGQNLVIAYPQHLQIDGDVAYRANVNRVADMVELSPTDDSIFWFGDAAGTVNFSSDVEGISLIIDSDITDMAAAKIVNAVSAPTGLIQNASAAQRQWEAIWQDANVKLTGGIKFNHDFDAMTLDNAAIQSSSVSGFVSGKVEDLYASMNLDVTGAWQPDWNQVNGLLAEMTGQSLRFTGNQAQRFTVRGPMFANPQFGGATASPWVPETLFANASMGWEAGEMLGLPVGPTTFSIALNQGVAQVSTDGIPFAGGRVQMAPVIDLRSANPELKMDRTRVIDNVQLQPETARQWLRFVAPLVADATSAEGSLTLDVASASVPLLAPEDMQASGTIQVNQVAIGAGPLANQLLDSVKQLRQILKPGSGDREVRTTLKLKDQSVPFLVQDSRVYHKEFDFTHNDLTIRTSGSVGFDQTIQMTAAIPIADDWIDGEKYLAGLKGESLNIPIGGTVSKPQIDQSQVARLSQELLQKAASSAAQQAIQDKLSPKINQYQQKFNDKLNGGFNKLQGKLQGKLQEGLNKNLGLDKLGIGGGQGNSGGLQLQNLLPGQRPPGAGGQQPPAKPDAKELLKGLGDLFN